MILWTDWFCFHEARMSSIRFGPSPFTCFKNAGDRSMTSRVLSPKTSTIFCAYFGPIPLTKPLPKYLAMPAVVCGGVVRSSPALNC